MTPNDLDVLIHYHVSPFEHSRADAPAVQDCIHRYICQGILQERNPIPADWTASYELSVKGRMWLDMILETPQPILVLTDPRKITHETL